MRHLLADLDKETREALKTLYGFSEVKSRKQRDTESWSPSWEGIQPKFINLVPLLLFDQDEKNKARDFFTGRKRKVSGDIIHKASNVMQVHESKKVVGFQLVRFISSQVGAQDELRRVDPGTHFLGHLAPMDRLEEIYLTCVTLSVSDASPLIQPQGRENNLERLQYLVEILQRVEMSKIQRSKGQEMKSIHSE